MEKGKKASVPASKRRGTLFLSASASWCFQDGKTFLLHAEHIIKIPILPGGKKGEKKLDLSMPIYVAFLIMIMEKREMEKIG